MQRYEPDYSDFQRFVEDDDYRIPLQDIIFVSMKTCPRIEDQRQKAISIATCLAYRKPRLYVDIRADDIHTIYGSLRDDPVVSRRLLDKYDIHRADDPGVRMVKAVLNMWCSDYNDAQGIGGVRSRDGYSGRGSGYGREWTGFGTGNGYYLTGNDYGSRDSGRHL